MLIFYKSHYAASVDSYYGDFVLTLKVIFTSHVYSFSCSRTQKVFSFIRRVPEIWSHLFKWFDSHVSFNWGSYSSVRLYKINMYCSGMSQGLKIWGGGGDGDGDGDEGVRPHCLPASDIPAVYKKHVNSFFITWNLPRKTFSIAC